MNRHFSGIFLMVALTSLVSAGQSGPAYTEPLTWILATSIFSIILIGVALYKGNRLTKKSKKVLFILLTIPIVMSTFYMAGHTLYENAISITKGPVHWHADYQVFVCGEKLDLVNPRFPSNKIGSPLFHEHNDDRIHVEGTVMDLQALSLSSFFSVIGGKLETGRLSYPTSDGIIDKKNGDECNGNPSTLKVYVNGRLIDDYDYNFYPDAYSPPGDCITISFDDSSEETDERLCESWEVKGWSFKEYERKPVTLGGQTWQ